MAGIAKLVPYCDSESDKSLSPEEKIVTVNILNKFAKLLESDRLSDVKIVTKSKSTKMKIPAHKFVLVAQSPVFDAMFSTDENMQTEEKTTGTIKIEDYEYEEVKNMLKFMYSGKVEKSAVNYKLLGIAQKYQLQELKDKCERYLASILSVENAAETMVWAAHHQAEELKNEAMEFIYKNHDVVESDGWKLMKLQNHLQYVIYDLFEEVMRRLKEQGISPKKRAKK